MSLASGVYIYEFLYRGQPAGSLTAPDFHVILAAPSADVLGNATTIYSLAMTPAQAVALGMTLPTVVANIVATVGAQITAVNAALAALQAAKHS
jgi:hypothetical protein